MSTKRPSDADMHLMKQCLKYCPITGKIERLRAIGRAPKGECLASKSHGYLVIGFGYRTYLQHHVAWFLHHGEWPGEIDHKNLKRDDNRICNLRDCTSSQNKCNTKLRSDNTSGFKGVYYYANCDRYWGFVALHGKRHSCGYFKTKEEAAEAVKKKRAELHGEFKRDT